MDHPKDHSLFGLGLPGYTHVLSNGDFMVVNPGKKKQNITLQQIQVITLPHDQHVVATIQMEESSPICAMVKSRVLLGMVIPPLIGILI